MLVDLRPGLRNCLLSNTDISSMVGGTRVFPVRMKEGERSDSIVYLRVGETEGYHFTAATGLILARMQIDSWSQSTDRCNRLADLVKEHLGGFSGPMQYGGSSPSDYVVVQGVFLLSGFEDYDQEAQLYRLSRDFSIVYEDRQ